MDGAEEGLALRLLVSATITIGDVPSPRSISVSGRCRCGTEYESAEDYVEHLKECRFERMCRNMTFLVIKTKKSTVMPYD